jgi:Lipocalin-like domain
MRSIFAVVLATSCSIWPAYSFGEDAAAQLVGTWKLVSWLTKFDGGEIVEPYGPNAKGRLVLTPDGHWIIILTGANRKPAKSVEEKAALLDSMLAYSGAYTVEANQITTHVEVSSNEIYTGANQNQTRFFRLEGDRLTLRTPEIVSAVRVGQKAVGTITFEREW